MNNLIESQARLTDATISRKILAPGLLIILALFFGVSIGLWPISFWTLLAIIVSIVVFISFPTLPLLAVPLAAVFYTPLFTSSGQISGNITALDLVTHLAILSLLVNIMIGRVKEPWKRKSLVIVVVLIVFSIVSHFIIRQVILQDDGVLFDLALQWKLYLQFVMLGMATLILVDEKSVKFIKLFWSISIAIASLSVLFQVGGIWTVLVKSNYPAFGERGVGLLHNPNIAAMFFVISFGLIIDQLWVSRKSNNQLASLLWYPLALLQILALLATGSRAAVLIFVLALLLFSTLRTSSRSSAFLQFAIILLFAISMLFLSSPGAILLERFSRSIGKSILLDPNVSVRIEMWEAGLQTTYSSDLIRQLAGWGKTSFLYAIRSTTGSLAHYLQTSDNTFIDWLIDVGVIGTLTNIMLFIFPIWYVPRRLIGNDVSGKEWIAISTIMLSFTYSTLSSPSISATVLGLGCLLAVSSILKFQNHSSTPNPTGYITSKQPFFDPTDMSN